MSAGRIDPARLCLAEVSAGPGGAPFIEDVPAPSGTPAARAWRDRELERAVDPASGPARRAVLLRYLDGATELVTVTHRAGPDGHGEDLTAALDRIDAVPPPDWGLGDPAAGDAFDRLELPATAAGPSPEVTVPAALALALRPATGDGPVTIGTADPRVTARLHPEPDVTVAHYLDRVRAALAGRGEPALVGVTVTGPRPQHPFLAPVQPLSIHAARNGDGSLRVTAWYRRRYFDGRIVDQLGRHLAAAHRVLVAAGPGTPLGELEVLGTAERRRLLVLGGFGRRGPAPDPPRIEEAVAAQAALTPDAVAVCCRGTGLSYAELDRRADRVAAALRDAGVGRGTRVGVCLDRSPELIVTMLAVLKAGGAYVPLDPRYPVQRLASTVADAGMSLVIGERGIPSGSEGARWVQVSDLERGPAAGPAASDPAEQHAGDPAYVIYTSGSTGVPKGVVVPHRNVTALIAAVRDDFGLGGTQVWTMFHSPAFDFSVWEIWGCLTTGGRLVIVPFEVSRAPAEFVALLAAERVTVLSQTPSAFWQLAAADRDRAVPGSVRLVVLGGEPLDTRPLLVWFDRHPETRCRLVNMFGITETTVHVTAQTVTRREALAGSRSVGRPLPGWWVRVLDGHGRPAPVGVAGEIHVGGAGVADGYLNRPELTAQRFVIDPDTCTRTYRSGDRGRLLPDGRLEHLGRLDDQVQLRGFRIEPDEVRAALLSAPGVVAAAVVPRQYGEDAATAHLAAYVVFGNVMTGDMVSGDASGHATGPVLDHVARRLPEHMVPATVTALPALPLTTNGKVDVARLPRPVRAAPVVAGPTGPGRATLADRVTGAWENLFGFQVGLDDDFFGLGGNSLLAVRLAGVLRAAGLPPVSVRELYRHRTVRRLAAALESAAIGTAALESAAT